MNQVVVSLALLHDGGWDEVLMVGAGLILAYVIIMLTGRKARGDEEPDAADDELVDADEPADRRP